MNAPIPRLVGVGEVTAADLAVHAKVIKLGWLRSQARFDVAQALPVSELREGHAQELIEAAEAANVEVASILGNQSTKGMPRHKFHHLSEHQLASVHRHLPDKSEKPAATGTCRQIVYTPEGHGSLVSSGLQAVTYEICRTLLAYSK